MNQYTAMKPTPLPSKIRIDLRSDTVTLPSPSMRDVMQHCPLGDDVYGDDPSVMALEQYCANLLKKEAALFFPTGTQSNLAAILAHCQRGEEALIGDKYHTFTSEARGVSVLGGVSIHPIRTNHQGHLDLEHLRAEIKPDDFHSPISRLVCLENTVAGCVQPQQHIDAIASIVHQHHLKVHLDGARLFNAAIAQQCPAADLVSQMDSVSICLSKGLGAPAGSVLLGTSAFIQRAKRLRKMLGGGMRQSGILAAAGLYALQQQMDDLALDHQHTQRLALGWQALGIEIDTKRLETNMLFLRLPNTPPHQTVGFRDYLAQHGILMAAQQPWTRIVLHRDIHASHLDEILALSQQYYQNNH